MAFIDTVKQWFKTGDYPTQAQFYAKFAMLRWKDEKIPAADVEGLVNVLNTIVSLDNVRGMYADSFILEGDGTYLLPRGTIITGIIIDPKVDSDISIGRTSGGWEHMTETPLTANTWNSISTLIPGRTEQLVYFTGITSPTLIIILKNSIQLPA